MKYLFLSENIINEKVFIIINIYPLVVWISIYFSGTLKYKKN